ncbi:MAG: formate dehydrogenase accessory sulfurtransferase FdhD [Chloroflexota bacterium]
MSRLNKTRRRIWEKNGSGLKRKTDYLATEEPLEIRLSAGGETRTAAITMRTPGNDYELAAGFLFNEGLISEKEQIAQITYCVGSNRNLQEYNSLEVQLRLGSLPELPQLDRHFFMNSACGICGATMLDDLRDRGLVDVPQGIQIDEAVLNRLPGELRKAQHLFESTGGLHAAALFDVDGTLLALREDIGRHNALDKLIGWGLLQNELPFSKNILMVSGRASYELLQKAISASAPLFCAVSAPSSLAAEIASEFGITLVGFLREDRYNVYTRRERILT